MRWAIWFGLVWLGVLVPSSARADIQDLNGVWKVMVYQPFSKVADMVLRIDAKDPASLKATILDGLLATSTDAKTNVKVEKNRVVITFEGTVQVNAKSRPFKFNRTLDLAIPEKDAKLVRGTLAPSPLQVFPLELAATDEEKLPQQGFRNVPYEGEGFQKLRSAQSAVNAVFAKLTREKDKEKRKELIKERDQAMEVYSSLAPKIHREILKEKPNSVESVFIALTLLADLKSTKPTQDEVKSWASTAEKLAESFGPPFREKVTSELAKSLHKHDDFASIGLGYVRKLRQSLSADAPLERQAEVMTMLAIALKKSKTDGDELATIEKTVAELNHRLDGEYAKKIEAIPVTAGTSRKDASKRPVLFELFTGAQCPPCVAADVAFDLLAKAYKAEDVVLLQYHVHIPGPDPLTNPETMGRFETYAEAFPDDVRGAPSTLFNGKPMAPGGGPFEGGAQKFAEYQEVIDRLLNEEAGAEVRLHATAKGDQIDIVANVHHVKKPSDKTRLRLVLVEEKVHYTGGNKVRLHHQVVRAFGGGAKGLALTEPKGEFKATINLVELRKSLTEYLDEYSGKRTFSNANRPMEMAKLRVVAFVQDDATHEVLQAVQTIVKGGK